jgi:hypothetical protein
MRPSQNTLQNRKKLSLETLKKNPQKTLLKPIKAIKKNLKKPLKNSKNIS